MKRHEHPTQNAKKGNKVKESKRNGMAGINALESRKVLQLHINEHLISVKN